MKSTQGSQEQVLGETEWEQPHSQPKQNVLRVFWNLFKPFFLYLAHLLSNLSTKK